MANTTPPTAHDSEEAGKAGPRRRWQPAAPLAPSAPGPHIPPPGKADPSEPNTDVRTARVVRSAPRPTRPGPAGSVTPGLGEIRTDLAIEAARSRSGTVPGISVQEERHGPVTVSRVRVETAAAAEAVGKRVGNYVTLEAPELRRRITALHEQLARLLAAEVRRLLQPGAETTVLVVGLGNWNATPDALGPRVVANLLITRHLRGQVPDDLRGGLRSVAAIAPGVLGLTGIETGEIIRAVVDRIRPDVVLAVDALASRSIERILTTIQLADTGINPGSGVGNDRGGLTQETLGVPVVALGVPTVVHATTIAYDTIELLIDRVGRDPNYRGLENLRGEDKRQLIEQVLTPSVGDLMVTPKEIDVLMEDMSKVIAAGINAALHPKIADQPALF